MTTDKKEKIITQPPINQKTLKPLSMFISHCSNYGVRINSERLEKLHKDGLLFPCLKIYRGITISKKILATFNGVEDWRFVDQEDLKKFKPTRIDPKKYYSSGGFNISGDDWLKYYQDNKMIEMPASKPFKPWIGMTVDNFTTDIKSINKSYDFFYDKHQLFALKIIIKYINLWDLLNEEEKKKYRDNILKYALPQNLDNMLRYNH